MTEINTAEEIIALNPEEITKENLQQLYKEISESTTNINYKTWTKNRLVYEIVSNMRKYRKSENF